MRTLIVCTVLALSAATSVAQAPAAANPRFGAWKLKSETPAPASNVMTYEAFGATGMKVTIVSVSARSDTTSWWYTTEFDGKDMPVTGNRGPPCQSRSPCQS